MKRKWSYSELSHTAKEFGGPTMFLIIYGLIAGAITLLLEHTIVAVVNRMKKKHDEEIEIDYDNWGMEKEVDSEQTQETE